MSKYNPTPKAEFLISADNLKRHHMLVENPILRDHLEVALAEYTRRQSAMDLGPDSGAARFLRIQGAHELLDVFLNLAESPTPPSARSDFNLPHNQKTK